MKILTAMMACGFFSLSMPVMASLSNTSANPTELTVPTTLNPDLKKGKLPEATTTDSYESPTAGSGDLSTIGETSTKAGHETRPLYRKKKAKKTASTTNLGNCDNVRDKTLCERTNQMNKTMKEKSDHATATQRGVSEEADRNLE